MKTVASDCVLPHPPAPTTLQEAGLNADLVLQLVIKTLHLAGQLTGNELATRLGLRFSVIEPVLDQLKNQHHVEIAAGSFVGGASYRYRITDAGRARAAMFLEQNQYVGFAPVPLSRYQQYLREHERMVPRTATQERVRNAFSHLVLSARVLDQLGPAINSRHSVFVYGPPGNGKTVISQAVRNLLDGDIAIPHSLEVEGHIVRLFDPVVHEPLPMEEPGSGLDLRASPDARWVRCRRPLITVGGELTLDQVELAYNPIARFYHPPVQALANGGALVIDDFGRQQAAPQALLNRWIVPLESRVDFLTLQTGQKFELPFNVLMIFATNIRPKDLVDEAFLRRIHYKVFAESPTVEEFALIFRNCCVERGVEYDRALVDHLLKTYYRPRDIVPRGCHPRDLIDHALSLASYLGKPPHLTPALLDAACAGYFVDDQETAPVCP